MDQSLEVTKIKTEPTESTSSDRLEFLTEMQLNSVTQDSNCLVESEIYIKTEPREDENDFPTIAGTSSEMCPDYNKEIDTEKLIKLTYEDLENETIKDPLDGSNEIKDKNHFSFNLNEPRTKTKPTGEENDGNLLETNKNDSQESGFKRQNQLLIRNDLDHKDKKYKAIFVNMSCKKRKRTQNTSNEQYEQYVKFLEKDYNFCSNTVNPTLGENYLDKKWAELACQLNSIGEGPQLSAEDWKKRFTDWKYSVRNKYKKIKEGRSKTGSGSQTKFKLNPFEKRAITLWRTVGVMGSPFVNNYDGLAGEESASPNLLPVEDNVDLLVDNTNLPAGEDVDLLENSVAESNEHPGVERRLPQSTSNIKKKYSPRIKPLSVLTENLLENTDTANGYPKDLIQVLDEFSSEYLVIEKEKIEVEKLKLKFQIAKYKFENPTFEFDF